MVTFITYPCCLEFKFICYFCNTLDVSSSKNEVGTSKVSISINRRRRRSQTVRPAKIKKRPILVLAYPSRLQALYTVGAKKKASIPFLKGPKMYAVLSNKRTVWTLCVLVPYFNILITSSTHVILHLRLFFNELKLRPLPLY